MSKRSDEIRNKYIQNPPEGMTADDIRHMSEDDLLDMDYFLNEDDEFGEDFPGAEGFYICLLYTSPSPRDRTRSRMPSSA